MSVHEIPLSEAAQRLRLTWAAAYSRLLTGQLRGRKVGSRWLVELGSVQALEAARRPTRDDALVAAT